MKCTTGRVFLVLVLMFFLQSTALAETTYKLKPASEITKNLFGMGVDKAKENPEETKKLAKDLMGKEDAEPSESEDEKKNGDE